MLHDYAGMNREVDWMGPVQPDAQCLPHDSAAAAVTAAQTEHGALLQLLNACVDSMHMLDIRMSDLETKARNALEASLRERGESRADTAILRTRTKLNETNLDQMQIRLAASETAAVDRGAKHTAEILAARAEAEEWRTRTERALAVFEDRAIRTDERLAERLLDVRAEVAETRSEAARMQQRAVRSETAADALKAKLAEAAGAIADQRARIACLQAKLGAAKQTSVYLDQINDLAEQADATPETGVIDLLAVTGDHRNNTAA